MSHEASSDAEMALSQTKDVNTTAEDCKPMTTTGFNPFPKPFSTPLLFPDQKITFITNPELRSFFETRRWDPVMLDEFNKQVCLALNQRHQSNTGLGSMRDAVLVGHVERACHIWLCMDHKPAIYVAGTLQEESEISGFFSTPIVPKLCASVDVDLYDYMNFKKIPVGELGSLDEVLSIIRRTKTLHNNLSAKDDQFIRYALFGRPIDVLKYHRTYYVADQGAVSTPTSIPFSVEEAPREPPIVKLGKRRSNKKKRDRAPDASAEGCADGTQDSCGRMSPVVDKGSRERKALRKTVKRKETRKRQRLATRVDLIKMAAQGAPRQVNYAPVSHQAYGSNHLTANHERDIKSEHDSRTQEGFALSDAFEPAVKSEEITDSVSNRLRPSTRADYAPSVGYKEEHRSEHRSERDRVAQFPISEEEKEYVYRRYLNKAYPLQPRQKGRVPIPPQEAARKRADAEQSLAVQKKTIKKLRTMRVEYMAKYGYERTGDYLLGKIRNAERLMAQAQARIGKADDTMTREDREELFKGVVKKEWKQQNRRNESIDFLTEGISGL